ncbi:hypothetical protein OROGR_005118 [Orobanche gracilis]
MAENPTSSSSPQRTLPLQQNPSIIEPSNSQQLQSPSPSLEHQQHLLQSQQQLVQQQQQLVQQQQQQMAQGQQQMVQPQQQHLQQLQQQLQQQQNGSSSASNSNSSNNLIGVSNFHQGLQRNTSMSRLNQMQQNSDINNQLGLARQQQPQNSGIYAQMNFGGMNTIQQTPQQQNSNVSISNTSNGQQTGQPNQLQQQIGQQGQFSQQTGQQNQLSQQQMAQIGSGNLTHSALMGQTGHLPMLSGQSAAAAAQFNLQSQFLTSPRQKAGFMQGSQFHAGNSAGQSLQAMGMMGSLNLSSQLRNGTLPYSQQRMTPSQLRQHLPQQNALVAGQGQNITRTSFMNGQISGLAQNGQPGIIQNALSQQQQWLKQMPAVASPNSSSLRLQQQRQQMLIRQQQLASSQLQPNSLGLNPQQLSELVQQQTQMGHSQQKQQQQQQVVQQQIFHQQQSPSIVGPGGAKSVSLTGSQPDATASGATTPGGSSSQGTEASNQLLGKRKIQDLLSQMNLNGIIDPEVEDYLLELADHFINTVSSFSCTLAKHRKSSTLEAKDVLLHLEKNWNLTVPGFSSEQKKHVLDHPPSDAHKKRLHVVKYTMTTAQIRNLMEPVKSEASTAAKQMVRQGQPTNQVGSNHMIISPSPSSDQFVSQSPVPQMLQQAARF